MVATPQFDTEIRAQLAELGLAGSGRYTATCPQPSSSRAPWRAAKGYWRRTGRSSSRPASRPGRSPERPLHRQGGRRRRPDLVGRRQPAVRAGPLRPPARQGARLPARARPVRLRRLCRRGAHVSPADPRRRGRDVARALREHPVRAAHPDRARGLRARLHRDQLRCSARQRRLRRHAHRRSSSASASRASSC